MSDPAPLPHLSLFARRLSLQSLQAEVAALKQDNARLQAEVVRCVAFIANLEAQIGGKTILCGNRAYLLTGAPASRDMQVTSTRGQFTRNGVAALLRKT